MHDIKRQKTDHGPTGHLTQGAGIGIESKIFLRQERRLFLRLLCFVHTIFRFWFLVTFGDEVTKIQKYYVIFVYILHGKMGKMGKMEKETERKSRN